MAVNRNRPSEFGGHPGLLQPSPHVPTEAENMRMLYQTDESNEDSQIDPSRVTKDMGDGS